MKDSNKQIVLNAIITAWVSLALIMIFEGSAPIIIKYTLMILMLMLLVLFVTLIDSIFEMKEFAKYYKEQDKLLKELMSIYEKEIDNTEEELAIIRGDEDEKN